MEAGRLAWLPVFTEGKFRRVVGDKIATFRPAHRGAEWSGAGQYLIDYGTKVAEKDLDRAVEATGLAVSVTARGDPQRVRYLLALAHTLDRRYEKSKSMRDLDQAVEALDVATESTPDHALQTECQDLLVRVLKQRYEATASTADLTWAISALELIVDNTRRGEMHSEARLEMLSDLRRLRRQAMRASGRIVIRENEVLGHGSNGTTVYGGTFDGRDVAVKRVLARLETAAVKEIDTLRKIDGHPNVIRYYYQEEQGPFHYIALDRCRASLADVVTTLPSGDLPRLLLQIALGLSHLHKNDVVHRDLKPNNILLRDAHPLPLHLVLSDFGLAKTLDAGKNSMTATHVGGTFGWRAPELLLALGGRASGGGGKGTVPPPRASKTNDIFSLGLVFYYVLTRGRHPFDNGSADMHVWEYNIRRNRYSLGGLTDVVAQNLIRSMLSANPAERPNIQTVLTHPFFWNAEKRLIFLCEVSDDLEPERYVRSSKALADLESRCGNVFTGDFLLKLNNSKLVNHVTKKRSYNGSKLQELLRLVRNMYHHYHEQPAWVQQMLGSLPEGFMDFWTTRFPNLFLSCWLLSRWKTRADFAKYHRAPTHA